MKTYETIEDCPPVEKFIWKKIAVSFYYFEGVEQLSFAELLELRSLAEHQLQLIIGETEQGVKDE